MAATEPNPETTTPTPEPAPASPPPLPHESPLSVDHQGGDVLDDHPELLVAGAFVGGLVIAQVLRKLGPS